MNKSEILKILKSGELELTGQFTWGSNYTFLANVGSGDEKLEAVYKPTRGERPLWDFPAETLAGREVAAYVVSEALGWELVPPTVLRKDGPHGPGSLQMRVEHDPEQHYFTFDEETRQRLRQTAVFDLLINNADRKGGHILLGDGGKIWLIDHGICFHVEAKLRTVIWDFAGEEIPDELIADVGVFSKKLKTDEVMRNEMKDLLAKDEIKALGQRGDGLFATRRFPSPPEDMRAVPWPMV
jgi:uncharacterized repeat protein (TIGR03843 family)